MATALWDLLIRIKRELLHLTQQRNAVLTASRQAVWLKKSQQPPDTSLAFRPVSIAVRNMTAHTPALQRVEFDSSASQLKQCHARHQAANDVDQVGRERLSRLIRAVAANDQDAFHQLYEATNACLMGVAQAIVGRRELAEEVLQDAYLKVWNHADSFDRRVASPMTWLITIVRRRAIDLRRVSQAEMPRLTSVNDEQYGHLADTVGDASAEVLFLLQRQAARARLEAGLATLNAQQRQAVALVIYRGMTAADIARQANVPLSTAKTWVRRGFSKLAAGAGDVA